MDDVVGPDQCPPKWIGEVLRPKQAAMKRFGVPVLAMAPGTIFNKQAARVHLCLGVTGLFRGQFADRRAAGGNYDANSQQNGD